MRNEKAWADSSPGPFPERLLRKKKKKEGINKKRKGERTKATSDSSAHSFNAPVPLNLSSLEKRKRRKKRPHRRKGRKSDLTSSVFSSRTLQSGGKREEKKENAKKKGGRGRGQKNTPVTKTEIELGRNPQSIRKGKKKILEKKRERGGRPSSPEVNSFPTMTPTKRKSQRALK